ncbi:unnamed protein product [Rhodiola kirilowii]
MKKQMKRLTRWEGGGGFVSHNPNPSDWRDCVPLPGSHLHWELVVC